MKKICASLALLLCLSACSQEVEPVTTGSTSGETTQGNTGDGSGGVIGEFIEAEAKEFPSLDNIQVDLNFKDLSATMAYSQAMMMMYQPDDYWGQTMRLDGTYMFMDTPEFGDVHLVLLLDETNCCQGFVEFDLPSGAAYPVDGEYIGLVGTFTLVEDPDLTYSILKVNEYAY